MILDWYIVYLAVCGIPVQAVLGWMLGKGFVKACWAFACAVSVCRWGFAVGRVWGFSRPAWRWVPELILTEWWAFFVDPYDSISKRCHGGTWKGIGNWHVFPRRESDT